MAVKKKEEELPFEEALARLESIVGQMEGGDLPLEEVIKKYEQGMNLAALCSAKLSEAERRIEILSKRKDGSKELVKFEDGVARSETPTEKPINDENNQESLF